MTWPGIQGRGEYVRLAFEEAGVPYLDIAFVESDDVARPPFACPFLKVGGRLIGQTPNILLFLGGRLGLAPRDEAGKLWVHQLQLTLADFIVEIHDTHHPLGGGLYYEEQKGESRRRAREFRTQRLPKFLGYFERVMERNPESRRWMAGPKLTYVDLSMAQVIAGLRYAFPKASRKALGSCPRLRKLHDRVFARSRIARYVKSPRRLAFNNDDIFRRYPPLDS